MKISSANGVIDLRSLSEAKDWCIQNNRSVCSDAIKNAGLDEKTQLNAIAGIYSPERCETIKNYIAACRNEYLRCKALILAATSNEAADSVQYIVPPVPENL